MRNQTLPVPDISSDEENQTQSSSDIIRPGVDYLIPKSPEQDRVLAETFLEAVNSCGIQIIMGDGENKEIVIPPKMVTANQSQEPREPPFTLYIKDLPDLIKTLRSIDKGCERILIGTLLIRFRMTDYQLATTPEDGSLQVENISLPLIALQALGNASLGDLKDSKGLQRLMLRTSEHMEQALSFVGLEPVEVGKFEVQVRGVPYECSILFGIKFHDVGYESPASFNFHLVPKEALATAERWNRVVTHIRRLKQFLPRRMGDRLPYLLSEVDPKDMVDSWDLPVIYAGMALGTGGEKEGWIYGIQDLQKQQRERNLFPETKIASQLEESLMGDGEEKIRELILEQRSILVDTVRSNPYLTKDVPSNLIGQLQNPDYKAKDIFDSEAGQYLKDLREMQKAGFVHRKEQELLTAMENLLMLEEILDSLNALPPSIELLTRLRRKISRLLYKMDEGLPHVRPQEARKSQTTPDENDDCSYDPGHFLKDIPKPHFASLVLAISALHGKGIRRVHIIPFKPVRYLSHELSELNNGDTGVRVAQEIEKSTTDSFIMMAYRLPEQIEGVRISLGEDDVIGMGEVQIELDGTLRSTNPTIQMLINTGTKSAQTLKKSGPQL